MPAVAPPGLVGMSGRSGPFLSVYLTTEVAVEHAAQLADRRWKSVRRQLVDDGAPQRYLAMVDDLVPEAHLEGAALGAVVGGTARSEGSRRGEARVVDHDADPLARDLAMWGHVPVLTPPIAWRQHEPPYVCVLVDRKGADILAVSRDDPPEVVSAGEGRRPVAKVRGGGRAHWRYEHRVEENWARNERQVATEVERLVDDVGARLVAVAGDERAVGILREALPDRVAALVETVTGSRAAESAHGDLGDDVARRVHTVESRDTREALDALHRRLDSGRAVEGVEGTFEALRESRVDVLLVHDARLTPRPETVEAGRQRRAGREHAWCDPTTPELCSASRSELVELGVDHPSEGPLVDVAVRAALLSGGAVRLVPEHGGPSSGVGALLRWSD